MTTPRPFSGERWTVCAKEHVHWGANGAAGFLFRFTDPGGEARYLLTRRARQVEEPGTWGVPGGAMRDGESPETAAGRETVEEIGQLPPHRIVATEIQDCGGGWRFHLLTAEVDAPFPAFSVQETDATGWFTVDAMRRLPLHPGMRRWLDEHFPQRR
jgi:8-oxo-dGTP diphosphatase